MKPYGPDVQLPERAADRTQAAKLFSRLPRDLTGGEVIADGSHMAAGRPSFMDEMVRMVLLQRGARRLVLRNFDPRSLSYALASAQRRGVRGRVVAANQEETNP